MRAELIGGPRDGDVVTSPTTVLRVPVPIDSALPLEERSMYAKRFAIAVYELELKDGKTQPGTNNSVRFTWRGTES